MLIIPGINKFACLLTIKTRNGWTARNVLWLLPLLLPRTCTFPLPSSAIPRVFPPPPCLFLSPYFPSWHLRFDAGSLSDLPTATYIYSRSGSFTLQFGYFVRINIWRHSGSRTYTLGLSVSDTSYRRTPTFNRPSTAVVPSTRRIPWDTVFHNIYILSLLVVNSSDSGCYANYEIA